MVVVTHELQERHLAHRVIVSLEVPEEVLVESEQRNPDTDWLGIVYALDRVFLSHGGAMGQYRFLAERSTVLGGRTPVEVLPLAGGPGQFCRAAREFAGRPSVGLSGASPV